ncbi:MAG: Nramp family divalent metal transporter [Phaeodactylibacter sp.]|nr:Nramp family divalent metal transporter [Phaeodactylibacter sp.]
MPTTIRFRQRLLSILFWSILSAAFIGPGTVTTASRAGASFGLSLLWALLLSTLATILLQETAARITLASGKSLGAIVQEKYAPQRARWIKLLLFGAVAFGCAAYQAGNLLGAMAGLQLLSPIPAHWLLLGLAGISFYFLWMGNFKRIATLLGLIVALMGLAFLVVAFRTDVSFGAVLQNSLIPQLPEGSALLIIGLIGTTIVPYNLFLGSGISKDQSIAEMRFGLAVAILLGGIISMAVLVVGTQVTSEFSFEAVSLALSQNMGDWMAYFFGVGLCIAGLSSSITAPLAAAVTAGSMYGSADVADPWSPKGRNFRLVWVSVLGIGLLFGLLNFKPIPVIILAQAINGTLLPIVAAFLVLVANDKTLMGAHANRRLGNLVLLLIVALVTYLGLNNFTKALVQTLPVLEGVSLVGNLKWIGAGGVLLWLGYRVLR